MMETIKFRHSISPCSEQATDVIEKPKQEVKGDLEKENATWTRSFLVNIDWFSPLLASVVLLRAHFSASCSA